MIDLANLLTEMLQIESIKTTILVRTVVLAQNPNCTSPPAPSDDMVILETVILDDIEHANGTEVT